MAKKVEKRTAGEYAENAGSGNFAIVTYPIILRIVKQT